MQKHTPGPWTLDQCNSGWALLANGQNITAEPFDATDADARLIAAAPEMKLALIRLLKEHDALQMAEGSHEDRWSAATIARAILNKIDA